MFESKVGVQVESEWELLFLTEKAIESNIDSRELRVFTLK